MKHFLITPLYGLLKLLAVFLPVVIISIILIYMPYVVIGLVVVLLLYAIGVDY
jgi:hypothetical protein